LAIHECGQYGPKFSSWGDCEEALYEPEAVYRPPGASSEDPATARKAEKKKRFDGSRTAPHGAMAAGDIVRDLLESLRHGGAISAAREIGKSLIKILAECLTNNLATR